jgi:CheY-like chemotaxis protein
MARVLVIDDSRDVRATVRQMLERAGHAVTEAADGAVGMARLRRQTFDLVITNIFMPEKDGLTAIQEIRALHSGLPIIAISGGARHVLTDMLKVARSFGATATVRKPIDWSRLTAAVESSLAGASGS